MRAHASRFCRKNEKARSEEQAFSLQVGLDQNERDEPEDGVNVMCTGAAR